VDDASSDGTLAAAQALPRVYAVRNEENLGYGGTSHKLYRIALERNADFTVNIHGDLGHRPEDISLLMDDLFQRRADIVLGSRLLYLMKIVADSGWRGLLPEEARHNMPLTRIAGHFGLTWFQNMMFGTSLHSFHDGMRACSRSAIEWITSMSLPAWYDYDTELLVRAAKSGLKIGEVPVEPNYGVVAHSSAPAIPYGLRVVRNTLRIQRSIPKNIRPNTD
jgi:glycosyltransferase involved in cell wall biosynthesis